MTKKLIVFIATMWLLTSCADEFIGTPVTAQLKGLVKTFEVKTSIGITRTTWEYDTKTKLIKGFQTTSLPDNVFLNSESYVRDTNGRVVSAKVIFADASQNCERKYAYNSQGRLITINETTTGSEQYVEKFIYGAEGRLNEYLRQLIKGSTVATQKYLGYTWKNGNVETLKESTVRNGYEEQDFQYSNESNLLATLYQKEMRLTRLNPEEITTQYPTASEKLFGGIKYTYQYEKNADGKLIKQIINRAIDGQTSLESELTIEYF